MALFTHLLGALAAPSAGRSRRIPSNEQPSWNDGNMDMIRLGIGRAVYVYRLAYGELPDSQEALVAAGIMQVRYLRDENESPMEARREADRFVAQSTGPNAWEHAWQGLDARR